MKYYLLGIFIILCTYSIGQQDNGIDTSIVRTSFNLKGNISFLDQKSFKAEKYPFRDSLILENKRYSFFHNTYSFDSAGNICEELNYTAQTGKLYCYDSLNRLTELYSLYGENFQINAGGTLTWFESDGKKWALTFDLKNGSMRDSLVFTLNEDQQIIKSERFSGLTPSSFYEYEYGVLNKISKSKWISSQNKVHYEWEYFYDANGQMIKWIQSDPRTNFSISREFKYDEFGNKIMDRESNGHHYTWRYEYDIHGNWIKSVQTRNGVKDFIIIREIIYQ